MRRSDRRFSVYPKPRTTDTLGTSAPALNDALDQYAILMRIMRCEDVELARAVWSLVDSMLRASGR